MSSSHLKQVQTLIFHFYSFHFSTHLFICIATILFLNGASFDDLNYSERQFAFQQYVIKTQMNFEDTMLNYAKTLNQNAVILCDRGLMDGSAYITSELFNRVLADVNLDLVSARDSRYDAVFHLVTCAGKLCI